MSISRAQMNALLRSLEKKPTTAFEKAVQNAKFRALLSALAAAIERGDIEDIMAAAGIREGMWSSLTEAIRSAYVEGGIFIIAHEVPKRFGMEFDINNPRAETWLRNHSSQLITLLNQEQRAAIQVILQNGMIKGKNPRSMALDIVGRIGPTGRRQGGVIGLTEQQAKYVTNMADDLENLDPRYFNRKLRDRRFDKTVRSAMESGKPLPKATIDKIVGRYEDRMLKHRGDNIGRTEALRSLNEASDEAMRQVIDAGLAPPDAVTKIWRHSHSKNERPGHLAMNGYERRIDDYFTNPDTGAQLKFPGDGPASETVNCFVADTPIAVDGLKSAIRRHYCGDVIKLCIGSGIDLTVTPNHPVLTTRGWVAAKGLVKGDNLVHCENTDLMVGSEPDITDGKTTAEQLYRSAQVVGVSNGIGRFSVNLHGEVPAEDVDVVSVDRGLSHAFNSELAKFCRHFTLTDTNITKGASIIARLKSAGAFGATCHSDSSMGGRNTAQALIRAGKCSAPDVSFRDVRTADAKVFEAGINHSTTDANFSGYSVDWIPAVEHALNIGQELTTFGAESVSGRCATERNGFRRINRGLAQIRKTTQDYLSTYVEMLGNLIDRKTREFFHVIKVFFSLDSPLALKFAGTPFVNTHAGETVTDDGHRVPGFITDELNCMSRDVQGLKLVKLTAVDVDHYEGPVFNFETESGLILASAIITHNCRCYIEHKIDFIAVERAA